MPELTEIIHQFRPVNSFPDTATPLVKPEIIFMSYLYSRTSTKVSDPPHDLGVQVGSLFVFGIIPVAVEDHRSPKIAFPSVIPFESSLPIL